MMNMQPDEERQSGSALYPASPWQREERERQAEVRRAAARARRDATIAHLVALGAARSAAQSQQLRALQLERDFELRATQHDQEEGGTTEGGGDEDRSSPESCIEAPLQPSPHPPKSILKTNTRTELTNEYQTTTTETVTISEEVTSVGSVSAGVMSLSMSASPAPPPPPAPPRGSSFAVMAERTRHVDVAPVPAPAPVSASAPLSPSSVARDKRVSFEERGCSPPSPPSPPASSPPPLHEHEHREDPDRFIEEAESMLASPSSAGVSPSAAPPAHTPGVIGAQEVYRDPRARRLAEQQARSTAQPIPEQLSFKEKMKMFALEAGDASTPKDKVKISRAQRDIDAVR